MTEPLAVEDGDGPTGNRPLGRSDPAARPSEGFGPGDRLRRRSEFRRCYREGRRLWGSFANLFYLANELGHPRLGITASRRVGKAVRRHLVRRRIKEIYRRSPWRAKLPGVDLVVHVKSTAVTASFEELRASLSEQLRRVARPAVSGSRRAGSRSRPNSRKTVERTEP